MKYPLKVFKFGGASVRNAEAIRQVGSIIREFGTDQLIVVVSAMGKTTNALEKIAAGISQEKNVGQEFDAVWAYHQDIMNKLFPPSHAVHAKVENIVKQIGSKRSKKGFDHLYDQVVSQGEYLSSSILAEFLLQEGLPVEWIDAREFVLTDDTWREGKVDWKRARETIGSLKSRPCKQILITQGFIGRAPDGSTTTLGREGSDYSAAIFAACLDAESVTIWKDVPGVMNADPKRIPDASVFDELPYREAAEMTYYGASVIHPKTIKPLANQGIPLLVKNFDDPALPGTRIHEVRLKHIPPLFVFKENQCLISCAVTDYTFITEEQMGTIFSALAESDLKVNMMQNSAISFSFCLDFREEKVLRFIERLAKTFEVYYNTNLTLITIKNYDDNAYEQYRKKPGILLVQASRSTLQVLLKN